MSWMRALRGAAMGLFLALSVGASEAQATVVVELTRQQLVDRSDLVVRATVVSQASAWSEDHTRMLTRTQLRVEESYKGQGFGELTLQQLGGAVDGVESHIAGDGVLQQGHQYVLFLRRQNGLVFLTALSLAVYEVEAGRGNGAAMVHRDLHGLTMATWLNGQFTMREPGVEPEESLGHLVADVRRLATGGAR